VAGVLLFLWYGPVSTPGFKRTPPSVGIDPRFLRSAADLVGSELPGTHIFNTLQDGGYLLFRLRGRSKVFVDGRTFILYPVSVVMEAQSASSSWGVWKEMQRVRRIDVAVLPISHPDRFNSFLASDPSWPVVLLDDYHVVHVRADLLARHPDLDVLPIDLADPFRSLARLKENSPGTWNRTKRVLSRYAERAPGSFKISVLRAFIAMLENDVRNERLFLERALRRNPRYDFARKRLRELPPLSTM
jgi:hypothetical protein